MTTKSRKLLLPALALLLIPTMLLPLQQTLARLHRPDFLFGLSSDFYAGAAIGVAICTCAFGLAMLVRSMTATKS